MGLLSSRDIIYSTSALVMGRLSEDSFLYPSQRTAPTTNLDMAARTRVLPQLQKNDYLAEVRFREVSHKTARVFRLSDWGDF